MAELQYNNENESPEALAKSSEAILTTLGKEIGGKLPGATDKPASAAALPETDRIPNGIQFYPKDPFGLANVGSGAVGFYRDAAGKRWRFVAIARDDADQAKDTLKTIKGKPGAIPVAAVGDEAAGCVLADGTHKTEYLFARKGQLVVGVTEEDLVKPEQRLSKDEKSAKLKAWLAASK
jgi:hypothetical protein